MGTTILLVYGTWAIAPVVAYQALMAGLRDEGKNFVTLFVVYALALVVTYISLTNDLRRTGISVVDPLAVLLPGAGIAVLSGVLYVFGRKARGDK